MGSLVRFGVILVVTAKDIIVTEAPKRWAQSRRSSGHLSLKARRELSLSTKVSVSLNSVLLLPSTDEKKVDGYNLATKITYGPRNNCVALECSIPRGKLQQICPAESSIWDRSQFVGCKSQCATDKTEEHCGRGRFVGEERCPQSSKYFIDACPAAMAFAHDHQKPRAGFPFARVQTCDAKGEVKVQFWVAE